MKPMRNLNNFILTIMSYPYKYIADTCMNIHSKVCAHNITQYVQSEMCFKNLHDISYKISLSNINISLQSHLVPFYV